MSLFFLGEQGGWEPGPQFQGLCTYSSVALPSLHSSTHSFPEAFLDLGWWKISYYPFS